MGINIKVTNTKMCNQAKALNGLAGSSSDDINIDLDGVDMKDEAELLNNMTSTQVDHVMQKLEEYAMTLDQTERDYVEIKNLFADMQRHRLSAKEALRQHLPNLLTGALANIIGNMATR